MSIRVRWRRPRVEGQSWRYGHLAKTQPYIQAHIVQIIDDRHNNINVIADKHVQLGVSGPRGGRKWVPLDIASLDDEP